MASTTISSAVGKSSRAGFAFGAKETLRSQGKAGGWHCEVQIGQEDVGGRIMIGGDRPNGGKTVPITLFMYVSDVDEVFKAAIAAGATEEMAPADDFAGDNTRGASVVDPCGFTWYMATVGP
ncbi:MAG: hypothetical protein SGARI_002155 [Bacillariaceae sp.]